MRRNTLLSSLVLPVVFAWLVAGGAAFGQELEQAEKPAVEGQVRGRLPAYFAAVVTKKQRQEIYRIQARVQKEIDKLRQQIAELETKRGQQVDGVLDAEQLAEVHKKRAAAAERRRERRNRAAKAPSSPSD